MKPKNKKIDVKGRGVVINTVNNKTTFQLPISQNIRTRKEQIILFKTG